MPFKSGVRMSAVGLLKNIIFPNNGKNFGRAIARGLANSQRRRSARRSARASGPAGRKRPYYRRRTGPQGPRRKRPRLQMYGAPQQVAVRQRSAPTSNRIVTKTENANSVSNSVNAAVDGIALCAGDEFHFMSLAQEASQYQRFAFDYVTVNYAASCGTTEQGMIAIGCCASKSDFDNIKTYDQVIGLPGAQSFNVWSTNQILFSKANFNEQFDKGWTVVTPSEKIDTSQSNQVQGFIVWCVNGCDGTGTHAIGTLQVSYRCRLMKPKINPYAPPMVTVAGNNISSAPDPDDVARPVSNPWIEVEQGDTNLKWDFSWRSRCPFIVHFTVAGTGLGTLSATGTGITITKLAHGAQETATGTSIWFHCNPTTAHEGVFTITLSAATTCTLYRFVAFHVDPDYTAPDVLLT